MTWTLVTPGRLVHAATLETAWAALTPARTGPIIRVYRDGIAIEDVYFGAADVWLGSSMDPSCCYFELSDAFDALRRIADGGAE